MAKLSLLIWSTLLLVFFIALSESTHGPKNVYSPEPPILDDLFDRLASSQPSQTLSRKTRFRLKPRMKNYPRPIEPRNLDDSNRVLVSLPNKYQDKYSAVHKANDPSPEEEKKANDPSPEEEKKLIELSQWVYVKKNDHRAYFGDLSEVEEIFKRAKDKNLRQYYKDIPIKASKQDILTNKREMVTRSEVTTEPYNAIGYIASQCTGTFIGPRHILTAAHCIYNTTMKQWKHLYSFYQQKLCDNDKGIMYDWQMALIPKGWYQSEVDNYDFDYGMIILKDHSTQTGDYTSPPTMNFGWEDDATLQSGLSVSLVGYPADQALNCMWKETNPDCQIKGTLDQLLMDKCNAIWGNSGGPVYSSIRGTPTIHCITTNGNTDPAAPFSYCRRITKELFLTLSHWIKRYGYVGAKERTEWVTRKNDKDNTVTIATPSDIEKVMGYVKDENLPTSFKEQPFETQSMMSYLQTTQEIATSQRLAERKTVDKNEDPYSAVAMVTNNSRQKCTGTLIGPRHVLTAASCLYDSKTNTWLDGFKVNFLHKANKDSGSEYDWEMVIVPGIYLDKEWQNQVQPYPLKLTEIDTYDFGIILLKAPVLQVSPLNFGWFTDIDLLNKHGAYLVGYPGRDYKESMLGGFCKSNEDNRIAEDLKMYILDYSCRTSLGDTGAPLIEEMMHDDPKRRVQCIQKTASGSPLEAGPYCLRITKFIFASVAYWIKQHP